MITIPRILIVDDSESDLAYLEFVLSGVEASLIKTSSGEEALEATENLDLSLAILDIHMPSMDGYELAVRLNHLRKDQKVPIIFLTAAYSDQAKILEGYDAGAVDYLVKPLNKSILISKVNVFLEIARHKERIIEKSRKLEESELELLKAKEQVERLNQYLIDAREQEKIKISMMVHDELGQSMTALKIDLNCIRENLEDKSYVNFKLEKMIGMTDQVIKRVQRISSELHPGILEDLGLASAIEWYCREFHQRTGILCSVELEEDMTEDSPKSLAFFRILQEALTNVIRHAKATKVTVRLFRSDDGIFLEIKDNGIGIPEEKIHSGRSFGLIGMKTRARQYGGNIEFLSQTHQGTCITTHIP